MSMFTRQQLCAALAISESTVRRLEAQGLPCTPIGVRGKRYDLDECKAWLRARGPGGLVSAPAKRPLNAPPIQMPKRLRVWPSSR